MIKDRKTPDKKMVLPNFLCVGAQRSGTTTLHYLLRQHKMVFVPLGGKEPHFFDSPIFYQRGLIRYELQIFLDHMDESAIGEVTPSYMAYERAAARIRRDLGPDVKLIFCLRDPAARAYSHYISNFSKFSETETFSRALALEPDRLSEGAFENLVYGYIRRGYYFQHIKRFLRYFDMDRMFFIIFEQDIQQGVRDCMDRLFRFLGVPHQEIDYSIHGDRGRLPDVHLVKKDTTLHLSNKQTNESLRKVHVSAGGIIIGRPGSGVEIVRHPSNDMRALLEVWQGNRPTSLHLGPEDRRAVREAYFMDDIRALEKLLNKDLSIWYE